MVHRMISFAELLADPPLRNEPLKLDDGRECLIYELPIGVIDSIRKISEDDSGTNLQEVARVAAHALSGKPPTAEETEQVVKTFGSSSVMKIYFAALKFSQLTPDAVSKEKKH